MGELVYGTGWLTWMCMIRIALQRILCKVRGSIFIIWLLRISTLELMVVIERRMKIMIYKYWMYLGHPINWFHVLTQKFKFFGSLKDRSTALGWTSIIMRFDLNDGILDIIMMILTSYLCVSWENWTSTTWVNENRSTNLCFQRELHVKVRSQRKLHDPKPHTLEPPIEFTFSC